MYACIDLGSNSFHLLVGEWENGRIQIIERCSEKVQLGEAVGESGKISPAAFQRGISCLESFKSMMESHPLKQYWALGTNTFRVTQNSEEFIQRSRDLGIEISVISGVQEAVLIYAGVVNSLPISDAHRLVIDIGGGSTEVIVGRKQVRLLTESLAIGSVAWRDRYFFNSSSSASALESQMELAAEEARKIFAAVAPGIRRTGWSEAYASSGTVKMLAYICEENGFERNVISRDALIELKPKLAQAIANKEVLLGLKERRRDLLLAGWSVLIGLMESYAIEKIHFSSTALREGMIDFMVKNEKTLAIARGSKLPQVRSAAE